MKSLKLQIENYEFEVPIFEKDGKSWVALRPLCDVLGVRPARQRARVESSKMISWTHMYSTGSDGKKYEMLCIDIDHIGEWIFGINPNKVKPEIKERMYVFRRKLQHVLYAAVTGHIDINLVQSLIEEVKLLRKEKQDDRELINHLMIEKQLIKQYVDERLASTGARWMSELGHKKRKQAMS